MSFNRLSYDEKAYAHVINESTGPGHYMLQRPPISCHTNGACFPTTPSVRVDSFGAATCKNLVDVDSELMGLNRRASRDPNGKYIPTPKAFCDTKLPDGANSSGDVCSELDSENSRLTNPPCTLRSTGWNRWEWMCQNPQDKALLPFQTLINNRLIVKDNHRPCVPRPMDQAQCLPSKAALEPNCTKQASWNTAHPNMYVVKPSNDLPSIHWRKCNEIKKY